MNDEFKRVAYKRAVWSHLVNKMEGELIADDITPSEVVVCDALPFAERTVPQAILREVATDMQKLADACAVEMAKYVMVKRSGGNERESGRGKSSRGAAGPTGRTAGKAARVGGQAGKDPKRRRRADVGS